MADQEKQNNAAEKEPVPAAADAGVSSTPVLLKGEIEIYPTMRLPQLDQGPLKAYAAATRNKDKAFALICERHIVPLIQSAGQYHAISSPYLPRLIAAGTVDWHPSQQQRYTFVYENKLGNRIATAENANAMNLKNDLVLNTIIRNIVPAIKDMRDSDFVHGNIRVQNLYDGGGGPGLEKVMLGECLSVPHGCLQPTVYETIERSAASPLGRGYATPEDDMYAFGVMLAVLLRSSDPMAGFSDDEIITEKIENGSYAAITGKERFTGSLLECLRGLLNDDKKLRWTIDDVITWMEGRRVHPKQSANTKLRASRPLEFAQEKYLRPQMLALDMPKNPKEAEKLVEGKDLMQWLNRSLQDKVIEERVEDVITAARQGGNPGSLPERLACYVALALSPGMPLMFRGLNFMPEAFGNMLVEAALMKRDLNPYVEVIQNQMVAVWTGTQDPTGAEGGTLVTRFDTCRAFLRQTMAGYGVERCIYFMSPESHCLSEKLQDFFVRSSDDLLHAFEALASRSGYPGSFFDRHIIAFLSVRDRQIIDPYIPDLNADEKHRNAMASMRVLAAIQKRSKLPPMPGITSWLVDSLDPLINRFHDRDARTRIRGQLQKLKDRGDISKISALFDNPQLFPDDFRLFKQALRDYYSLRQEYNKLENDLETNKAFGHGTGRQVAAAVSALVAGLTIILYLFYKFSGGGGW